MLTYQEEEMIQEIQAFAKVRGIEPTPGNMDSLLAEWIEHVQRFAEKAQNTPTERMMEIAGFSPESTTKIRLAVQESFQAEFNLTPHTIMIEPPLAYAQATGTGRMWCKITKQGKVKTGSWRLDLD